MLQPDSSVPLYVCGEAYSHDQGWVEGALDTAEQVVELLGVQPPSRLSTTKSPDGWTQRPRPPARLGRSAREVGNP